MSIFFLSLVKESAFDNIVLLFNLWFCRSLVGRMNLDRRGSSVMASHHKSKDSRPKSAGLPLKSQAVGPDEDSYDDEEFESVGSPRLSSTHATPRLSWMETEHDMIDMSTQTVVHSGMVEKFLFEYSDHPNYEIKGFCF